MSRVPTQPTTFDPSEILLDRPERVYIDWNEDGSAYVSTSNTCGVRAGWEVCQGDVRRIINQAMHCNNMVFYNLSPAHIGLHVNQVETR